MAFSLATCEGHFGSAQAAFSCLTLFSDYKPHLSQKTRAPHCSNLCVAASAVLSIQRTAPIADTDSAEAMQLRQRHRRPSVRTGRCAETTGSPGISPPGLYNNQSNHNCYIYIYIFKITIYMYMICLLFLFFVAGNGVRRSTPAVKAWNI